MPLQFNGLKNVGGRRNAQNTTTQKTASKATLGWTATIVAADLAASNQQVPGFGGIVGWKFQCDPISVQSSFTFGDGKGLQLAIQRFINAVVGDGATYYTSGRTFIYVEATGQLFIFNSNTPFVVATLLNLGVDSKCVIVPSDSIATGKVDIFIEADNLSGTIVTPNDMAQVNVNLTLFNYDVPPVGTL